MIPIVYIATLYLLASNNIGTSLIFQNNIWLKKHFDKAIKPKIWFVYTSGMKPSHIKLSLATHIVQTSNPKGIWHTCLYLYTSKSNELCLQLQQRLAWIDHSITRVLHSNSIFLLKKNHSSLERLSEKTITLFWWVNSTTSITIKPLKYCMKNTRNITTLIYWVILFTYK